MSNGLKFLLAIIAVIAVFCILNQWKEESVAEMKKQSDSLDTISGLLKKALEQPLENPQREEIGFRQSNNI